MKFNKKIGVLIVDDSKVFAQILKMIVESAPDLEVVGIAKNGKEGLRMTQELKPDLITMDIMMPEMDGFEATKAIMRTEPTPIIVISSHLNNKELNATFASLHAGALTVINKPVNVSDAGFPAIQNYIINTIRQMSKVKVSAQRVDKNPELKAIDKTYFTEKNSYEVVVLGASIGGPGIIREILAALPTNFPLPILIVQHITEGFIRDLCAWLSDAIALEVKVVEEGEELKPGIVYFADDGNHFTVTRINNKLYAQLARCIPMDLFCPSISKLFSSVAQACGSRAIVGLLSGMGNDGVAGIRALHESKSHTFVQDEESSVVYSMPGSALNAGTIDMVVDLDKIAAHLATLVKKNK